MTTEPSVSNIREIVRERYAASARAVGGDSSASCCGESDCGGDPIMSSLYSADELTLIPENAARASLGCGNPTALATLEPGQVVLDLGSGGGIDVLLSARRVGPTGFAYGLDMTDEMLELAEQNRAKAGATNVKFLKGHIEDIPLPDNTADVVISNCVINLSTDKGQVLREAFRVLKPGGLFAVADVVAQGEMPRELRESMESWVGCIAGALEEGEYRNLLTAAGFANIDLEVTRVYDPTQLAEGAGCCGANNPGVDSENRIVSAFVRARKPSESVG
jgi:SAM-dependent methyltransferase